MQKNTYQKKFVIGLVFVLLGMFVLPNVSGDWWPMFGHDLGHSRNSTSYAPENNNTKWIFSTGGEVESSPAVYDYKVYVGSWDGKVYCLNSSTGEEIWNYTTSYWIGSSPAVADGKVYVGSYDNKTYCLNADNGSKIWEFTTAGYVYSSPAVTDGKVYIGTIDKIYCLDSSNGSESWNYSTGSRFDSSPAVVDGKVYIGSNDTKLYCLYANNGTEKWNFTTGGSIISSPSVVNDIVYIGSKNWKVFCLNASTGVQLWNYSTDYEIESSPAVYDGKVYIGSSSGTVYCLYANNGTKNWNYTTDDSINWSSPAVADGKVYIGSRDGKLYCFDADTGNHIWNYSTGDYIWSSPAIANGKVYVGSWNGNVYCFGYLPPVANFTFEPVSPLINQTIYFNSTSSDTDGSIVNWTWDFGDGNYSYYENVTYQYGDNGNYTVNLTVKDDDNATGSVEQVVSVVNIPPVANYTFEPENPLVNQTIYFNSTSNDSDGSIVNWTWDFGDLSIGYDENVTHQYVAEGNYTVNLTVKDNDNDSVLVGQIISVGNLPPNQPGNPNPALNATGIALSATLSWTGGDPNYGDTVTYDVYFGTTNPPTTKVSSNQTATSYSTGAMNYITKYYWKIVAWDSSNASTTGQIWAFTTKSSGGGGGNGGSSTPNIYPVADANGPYNGIIDTSITFDGSDSSDSDGTISSYDWIFGDGSTGKGVSITHSYAVVGNYTVKLTVTDNGGLKDTDTTFALITDKPNTQPAKPIISGNITGKKNTNYNYTVISIDEDNDALKYVLDWDDGTSILTTDFMPNDVLYNTAHSWAYPGVYTIKVKAVDEHNYTSETTELMVLIDAVFCDNIGYMTDADSNGIYELFHSNTTGNETDLVMQNGKYLIDSDNDGKWDYTFDSISGLSIYQEEPKDETPGFEFVFVICAIAVVVLFWKRKTSKFK